MFGRVGQVFSGNMTGLVFTILDTGFKLVSALHVGLHHDDN